MQLMDCEVQETIVEEPSEPVLPLHANIERSRIMGDYYRDLSANYSDHDRRIAPWPSPPFPPQHWVTNQHER